MGGVALQVGVDVLDPGLHPDAACRDANQRHPRNHWPTDAECLGRSAVHHVAQAHGLSADAIRSKLEGMGTELGSALTGVARATGMLRERSHRAGPRRAAYAKRRMRDQTEAARLRASERRRLNGGAAAGEGRRLSDRHREGRDPGARGGAGAARRHLHRSSGNCTRA